MARVTLARKIAAVMLSVWKTGEAFDPAKLSMQAQWGLDSRGRQGCRGRSPRLQRLEDPGPRVRGEVSSPRLSPAHSPAEVLSHARPPRRTRTSVRPAECRVSDRTVVRLENAIRACSGSPGTGSPNERGTMRKKTAPPRQEHPKASATERSGPNQTSGLIAKGEQGGRSARRSPTLDDRSHRTRRRGDRGVGCRAGLRSS